jgi:ATP-dependent helicase HrpB
MSATLDNDRLQRLPPEAPVMVSKGALSGGAALQPPPRISVLTRRWRWRRRSCCGMNRGSMLLFLPGVGEIQRVQEQLTERVAEDVILCPLYGAPLSEQRKAILPAPAGKRKVVLATNIAETSLTIEGIRLVVDSAQERVARFDPRTGLTRLVTQRISQASMTQRAGRAGRLSGDLPAFARQRTGGTGGGAERAGDPAQRSVGAAAGAAAVGLPRSGRAGLAGSAARGQSGRRAPPAEALSALDGERLSAFGRKMAALGNEPRLAAMLAAAQTDDEAATAAKLAAILEEPPRGGLVDLGARFPVSRPTGSGRSS